MVGSPKLNAMTNEYSFQEKQMPNSNLKNISEETNQIGKYGLNGLKPLLKMDSSDEIALAIGQDLNSLSFRFPNDLNILKNLASPLLETSRCEVEPYFHIPKVIQSENFPLLEPCQNKIKLFSDETLFFIFYMKPRDILQEYAARELVSRNWRYHKDVQVWLTKDNSVEPVLIGQNVEKGFYIFFDPYHWEKIKKEFILHYSSI